MIKEQNTVLGISITQPKGLIQQEILVSGKFFEGQIFAVTILCEDNSSKDNCRADLYQTKNNLCDQKNDQNLENI